VSRGGVNRIERIDPSVLLLEIEPQSDKIES
jgi:hypothetical protein